MKYFPTILILPFLFINLSAKAEDTVAKQWNEVLLEGIRNDYARPTVHARNLFHISAAMYDCWAVYDPIANTYFLGREIDGFKIDFDGIPEPNNYQEARNEALSYACYRLIKHRFELSPGATEITALADELMATLGYDTGIETTNYSTGSAAGLGNYLAEKIIAFGLQDGSNEQYEYGNLYYEPVNPPLVVVNSGNEDITDPNRWQPLAFDLFIDQAGNEIPGKVPSFLSPEWGNTIPFSLTDEDAIVYTRDGEEYKVYFDPGHPAYIDPEDNAASQNYKWNFSLVAMWSSHLDPTDNIMWDISPGSIGNLKVEDLPTTISGLKDFYNQLNGGDPSTGYTVNPKTGQPYAEQLVPRGDYARVLAEFWADGPNSETPPGHWFTILNYVNAHPDLVKKFKGEGELVDEFEWDVKSYFTLGGAMHDVAISAWGIKGYYDFIRPISAIRYMADQGQSSDPGKASYSEAGIPLVDDFIELVDANDPLSGEGNEHVGKIKLRSWKGPEYINDPEVDESGVDWILAENWWPYQRPSFVTPPFAGYVSGHSTFSRTAAIILASFTGDEYFPGGMGEFEAPKNEFLVFEEGPSVDVTLQWAKYLDASDQCSLSRIWGGIHPPVDDIPGRLIGEKIGKKAFEHAKDFFNGKIVLGIEEEIQNSIAVYPNPTSSGSIININNSGNSSVKNVQIMGIDGKVIHTILPKDIQQYSNEIRMKLPTQTNGIYLVKVQFDNKVLLEKIRIIN
ncbi:DUF6851 domain-containing protein [Reichenbachiella sp. MALMAid0571]|uniref:DUF6851 domain-containing protein n=1 Tax=Reichenbachiella sp. MALMAid0571 TaxID=3143939 RepID=UPI0032DEC79E